MQDKAKFISLNKTLVMAVLFVSTTFTTLATGVNFYIDYKSEKSAQLAAIEQIKKTTLNPLSKSLWDLDEKQIQNNLKGVLRLRDILAVHITNEDGEETNKLEKKQIQHNRNYIRELPLPLVHKEGEQEHNLGVLKLTVTNEYLYDKIIERMITFFVLQGLKTTIVSFLLFFLFSQLVTKHIHDLSGFFKKQSNNKAGELESFKFDKKFQLGSAENELDQSIQSLNLLINRINQAETEKQKAEKEREEALKQLAKLASLGEMAGNIGHEINNPLTIAVGYANRIKKNAQKLDPTLRSDMEERAEKLVSALERVRNISNSLRVLARDSSNAELTEEPVKQILTDVQGIVVERMKSREIDFEYPEPDENLKLICNRVAVGQVLTNLLNNAVHAISENKEKWIKILVEENTDQIIFKVVDSGKGLPPETLKNIFLPFFTTKKVGEGTGLGLSVSAKIIKAHGGQLYVDENAANTTFVIELPKRGPEKSTDSEAA